MWNYWPEIVVKGVVIYGKKGTDRGVSKEEGLTGGVQ
jgi:hypothetical protein